MYPARVCNLPVTTTRLSVFYLAQSAFITTRTTPDNLKCVKMQRRLNTDTLCIAKIINEELQILNFYIKNHIIFALAVVDLIRGQQIILKSQNTKIYDINE